MSNHINQYLRMFGLEPGATLQQISSRYFHFLKQFPENLTADQEQAQRRMQHAYEVLKRAYRSGALSSTRKKRKKKRTSNVSAGSRIITIGMTVALMVLLGVFLFLNSSNIRVKMKNHEAGDHVRWNDSDQTYGKVMRFEADHSFGSGLPGPAYQIQLDGTTDTVWVGERIAETRMALIEN